MQPLQLPLGVTLTDAHTFSNYLAGPNRIVLDTLRDTLSHDEFHCIYLHGVAGTGKTHLLQAACHHLSTVSAETDKPVSYVPMHQFIKASPEVFAGLEAMQLVCLDDIDELSGKDAWEEGLFNLFNRLRDNKAILLVTAQQAPDQAGFALPDLLSRLKWGLVMALKPLDDEQRLAALKMRCHNRGIELPPETATWLLRRMERNMDSIYQSVDELIDKAIRQQRRLTIPFVRQCYPELARH